jgi:hypothetical protein
MIMRTPPRSGREPLVGPWLFVRYMVIGIYVGCATVFGYAWWFIYYSGGPQITFHQLVSVRLHVVREYVTDTPNLRPTSINAAPNSPRLAVKCSATIFRRRLPPCHCLSWLVSGHVVVSPGDALLTMFASFCSHRDAQRLQFSQRKRVSASHADMGQPLLSGIYRIEHGFALYDPLRPVPQCEFIVILPGLNVPLIPVAHLVHFPNHTFELGRVDGCSLDLCPHYIDR